MIKIENTQVSGWEAAIRGMRNPMNSWDKSDTKYVVTTSGRRPEIGENDLKLAKSLIKPGSDHRKFLRYITVTADITAPLYWWKEFDTYKVGTVANSCSTMHKIAAKPFELDDFSHDQLTVFAKESILGFIIVELNGYREDYLRTKEKRSWWQMIQLLPSSYNQRRTVQLNYEVLRNMYRARKEHKLDEWRDFCAWADQLPYGELINMSDKEEGHE